jgi:plasmid stabilization system protein ParE
MRSAQSSRYHVEVLPRARRDLRHIYAYIHAENSHQAHAWFNGLEAAIASLGQHPARGSLTPESGRLRQLLYGKRPHVYRVIYAIDQRRRVVSVVHIRHGARDSFASSGAR